MENNQQGSGYGHDHDHDHDLDTAQEVSNAAFASADHQPTPSPVPTPGISEAPSNSYFEGLRPPTTEQTRTRSRSPGRSIFRSRSRTERPQPRSRETLGQPSIRIRRSQNSFSSARQNPLDRTITADPAATGSYPKHDNRPRSISQPERGGSAYGPAAKIPGRKPGAKPLEDLPRVTEEGRRPTLAELDVGPDATNSEAEQAEIPTRHRGRTWWGRRQREPPRPLTEQERADLDAQQAEAEYHERLVDWLDTVGRYTLHDTGPPNTCRPRGTDALYTHQRPKLSLRARSRLLGQPTTSIQPHAARPATSAHLSAASTA